MSAIALCMLASLSMLQSSSFESDLEVAFGVVGLSSKTARFDENLIRLFGDGEFTSPFFESCYENPSRIPFLAGTIRQDLSTMPGKPSASLEAGTRLLGYGTRRTLLNDASKGWIEGATGAQTLEKVLASLIKRSVVRGPIPSISSVPAGTQQAASIMLQAMEQASTLRKLALTNISDIDLAFKSFVAGFDDSKPEDTLRVLRYYRAVDMNYLAAGGHDLLLAAQAAQTVLSTVSASAVYDVEFDTIWGLVRLTGGTSSNHPDKPTCLIIDTGGDDTYIGLPSNQNASNGLSVVIDTAGNDAYLSDPILGSRTLSKWEGRKKRNQQPGPGGALLGYSVLIDSSGDDVYRTHLPGIGSARMGVAAVVDRTGSDTYDAYADSEGFGQFGVGILEDMEGDDKYFGFNQVQGVGLTMGFGYLVDRSGNDTYAANDTDIDFPSPQSAEHNVSMAQGAGNGRRADYLDGHSLSGGIGILYDVAGADNYSCGIFGQGVGYWKGLGMLWDSAGFDTYLGQWYVQGAAAHFAIGYLEDQAGNERYTAPMNMAQGAGHDFSIGFLLDRGGDDIYTAPNLSLGAGNANGIGIFADLLGNDQYVSSGITLGKAAEAPKQSLRSRALCLGVFFDGAGSDKYPAGSPWAVNGGRTANWTDRGPTPAESQSGAFWDR